MLHRMITAAIAGVITSSLLAVTPADAAVDRTPSRHRVFILVAGDSIAHGDGAAKGEGWSDVLQDECGATCRVKNVAMGSTCLVTTGCLWPIPLVESFDENVLARMPDLILVGVGRNDLCHQKTRDLLAGYKDLRGRARKAGIPIRFTTITPVTPEWQWPCEGQRVEVNTWLRTLDGTIDFEARASTPHGLLLSTFDYGDGLHITAAGYDALGRLAARVLAPQIARLEARHS